MSKPTERTNEELADCLDGYWFDMGDVNVAATRLRTLARERTERDARIAELEAENATKEASAAEAHRYLAEAREQQRNQAVIAEHLRHRLKQSEALIAGARTPPSGALDLHKMIANLRAENARLKARERRLAEHVRDECAELGEIYGQPMDALVALKRMDLDALVRQLDAEDESRCPDGGEHMWHSASVDGRDVLSCTECYAVRELTPEEIAWRKSLDAEIDAEDESAGGGEGER